MSTVVSYVCGLLRSPGLLQDQVTQGACLSGPHSSSHPKAIQALLVYHLSNRYLNISYPSCTGTVDVSKWPTHYPWGRGLSLQLGAREEGVPLSRMWGPRAGDTNYLHEKPGAAEGSGSGREATSRIAVSNQCREGRVEGSCGRNGLGSP